MKWVVLMVTSVVLSACGIDGEPIMPQTRTNVDVGIGDGGVGVGTNVVTTIGNVRVGVGKRF